MEEREDREFKGQAEEVRHYLRLAYRRLEIDHAQQARAVMNGRRMEQLRNNLPDVPADPLRTTKPSDLRCWYLTIGTILRGLGQPAAAVLCYRLLPRAKSSESAWEQVAARVWSSIGHDISAEECRRVFRASIPKFLEQIRARDIGDEYKSEAAA